MNLYEGIMNDVSKQANNQNEGDYLNDDGLMMCGKCHTPKQCREGLKKFPISCKCQQERIDAEAAERKAIQDASKIRSRRHRCFPYQEMEKWTFELDDGSNKRLTACAKSFVDDFPQGKKGYTGLLFYGPPGTGKTFIAACIANALIDKGRTCYFTNFARLKNETAGQFEGKQEYIDGLNRYDLLVIDDFAAERDTEYMAEFVHQIIDARSITKKPVIVTTNMTGSELKRPSDVRKQRIISRLYGMCFPCEVQGTDKRRQALKGKYEEVSRAYGVDTGNG